MSDLTLQDRFRGALLGLACGDALGTTNEFESPGSFVRITDMIGGGPFGLQPGQWTDDTSMALCLAESLIECDRFDARDQMDRYLRWRDDGYLSSTGKCFDVGGTVGAALNRYRQSGDPYAGSTDSHTAGNGSLMRLTPVVLFFANDAVHAISMAAESSRTTHGAAQAVDACRYFAALLIGALRGASKEELLSELYAPAGFSWSAAPLHPAIESIARGSFKRKEPPEIQGTGYVVQSLEAALWAFDRTSNFGDGCLAAANLGDDADTTAAIYGQIAGAYYGESGIPVEWRERVWMREMIRELADAMMERALLNEE